MKMIVLHMSDTEQSFWVNPENISAMYMHEDFTVVCLAEYCGVGTWSVKETPEQIIALAKIEVFK